MINGNPTSKEADDDGEQQRSEFQLFPAFRFTCNIEWHLLIQDMITTCCHITVVKYLTSSFKP